jgi:hypothetical protein
MAGNQGQQHTTRQLGSQLLCVIWLRRLQAPGARALLEIAQDALCSDVYW